MARNVAQPSRRAATLAQPQTKHAQHSPHGDGFLHRVTRNNGKIAPVAQRPVREAKPVEKHRKPRETVSVAGVFKKSKTNPREKKQHRRRRRSPSPPNLLLDLQGTIHPLPTSLPSMIITDISLYTRWYRDCPHRLIDQHHNNLHGHPRIIHYRTYHLPQGRPCVLPRSL